MFFLLALLSAFSLCMAGERPTPSVEIESAQEWTYDVEIRPLGERGAETTLLLHVLFVDRGEETATYWHTAGAATDGLPMPQRMGKWSGGVGVEPGGIRETVGQALLTLGERDYRASILKTQVAQPEEVQVGESWSWEGLTCELTGSNVVDGKSYRKIKAVDKNGSRSELLIEESTGRLVKAKQRLFIGRGDEFELQYSLKAKRELDAERAVSVVSWLEDLLAVCDGAGLDRDSSHWSPDDSLLAAMSSLVERAGVAGRSVFLAVVVQDVKSELERQGQRGRSLEELRKSIVGEPLPSFELTTTSGETISSRDLQGKVVLLHFWKYRHETLEAPYGHVGLLDFLARRANSSEVMVLGIAQVDRQSEVSIESQIQSARKLTDFMNLLYAVAIDDGEWLAKLGDPRSAMEVLPLWVVVDASGKVSRYEVGMLEVDPREGVRKLESWIKKAQSGDE